MSVSLPGSPTPASKERGVPTEQNKTRTQRYIRPIVHPGTAKYVAPDTLTMRSITGNAYLGS